MAGPRKVQQAPSAALRQPAPLWCWLGRESSPACRWWWAVGNLDAGDTTVASEKGLACERKNACWSTSAATQSRASRSPRPLHTHLPGSSRQGEAVSLECREPTRRSGGRGGGGCGTSPACRSHGCCAHMQSTTQAAEQGKHEQEACKSNNKNKINSACMCNNSIELCFFFFSSLSEWCVPIGLDGQGS